MITDSNIIIRKAVTDDISLIKELAHATWAVAYKEILSAKQLEYMLEYIYSTPSLQKQFASGHNFLIVEDDNKPVAFADYSNLRETIYKLNKIYTLPSQQGKGIGKLLINHVIKEVKEKGATVLLLNVNRHNKAKEFYEHIGFTVIGEEDVDIGEGYFMNDFIMEKRLD